MNCSICGMRSSIGSCVECKSLVCEECAIMCQECGKPVCRSHAHETPHSRLLCGVCMRERNKRFETVVKDMQEYCREIIRHGDTELGYLYTRLSDLLSEVHDWDKSVRDAYDRLEERIATRTQELQQEVKQRQHAERQLQAAMRSAETANRAKSDFLANMSHEIRTPMNAVIAMSELLLNTSLRPDQRRYVEAIRRSGGTLLTIIGDILDYSKIEAGRLTIAPIPFDLEVAASEIVELLGARAEEKGLSLVMRYAPNAPRRLIGDAGRIRQILTNLIGNAIKFTHVGHILVNIECLGMSADQALMRIAVEDTGIGIPKDKLPEIFRQFTQGDSSTSREYGGTGLGLTITNQLVNLMGGRIGVKSAEGVGSRFRVTIALDLDKSAQPDPLTDHVDMTGVRALIVDHSNLNQRIIKEQLVNWGVRCAMAPTDEAAMETLYEAAQAGDPFELILISHNPPGLDGARLGRAIADDGHCDNTVRVLLTANGQRGDAQVIDELGFSAYLCGPIRQSEFKQAIARVWSAHKANKSIPLVTRHTIAETRDSDGTRNKIQEEYIHARVLVAEDNTVNQEVATEILRTIGCTVDIAIDGEDAVAKFETGTYDAILMDCQMPQMDGYEATREIRRREAPGEHIPIIALTAHAIKGDRERCLEAGMDDYLAKPVSPSDVLAALMRWFRRETGESISPKKKQDAGNGLSGLPVLDKERALEITGGKTRILKRVTDVFLSDVPEEVRKLQSAIVDKCQEEAQRLAHSIKGAAATIGGARVNHLALKMEMACREGNLDQTGTVFEAFEPEFAKLLDALRTVDWEEEAG